MTQITDQERDVLADELLAVRCQLGEPAAFDALVERWNGPLWSYIHRLVDDGDEAAETLQEVWLRILRGLPRLREPARLRPWIFSIARRALMDRLRRQYAAPPQQDDAALAEIPAPEPEPETAEQIVRMQAELSAMPIAEREVLILFYLQELPLLQVAEVLAVPVGTVKSRLFRARRMLRERILTRGANDV